MLINKAKLERILSKYPSISRPKKQYEQYETPSSIAASMLWHAFIRKDITGKIIADLGCGNLKLGYGALVLGAKLVVGIDIDESLVKQAESILRDLGGDYLAKTLLINSDIRDLSINSVDTVIMNPPFGVVRRNHGLDILFLKKAMEISESIYTIHKYSPGLTRIIEELASAFGFRIVYNEQLLFPIPMLFETHRRKIYRVRAIFYVLRRK
ncbi:methyltransferase [Staphylothermus marinus F1]|uniref:Methyltransferase-like protein 5 n=1 Tax=Staphylothermus marinus (strain ATCC 43588 / DSM 3639 / JCM 9404 / F1) TaxID=399550 RepID=A3DM79_STAMF|nr:METTL5 family protein [Staphylothermus marinus]ABN69739.1 methyltransferase [Staphylothermus marinus F1]